PRSANRKRRRSPDGGRGSGQRSRCWQAAARSPQRGRPGPAFPVPTKTGRNRRARRDRQALRHAPPVPRSQALVGPVAERLAARLLAAAEPNLLARRGGEWDRGQPGAFVRAVAKRLAGAAPAGAPEIALAA